MLNVLYQDQHFLAINKPSGLLVHKTDLAAGTSENAMELLRDQLGQWVYPVHRLDRPTSGVLLFALSEESAKAIQPAFTEHAIQKHYLALVRGFTEQQGVIDHALAPLWDKKTDFLSQQNKPAQTAITHYETGEHFELPIRVGKHSSSRYSLVKAAPQTGRSRQIRRHFKHIFHPIIGDTAHGDGKHNALFREKFGCHRLLLHAASLAFVHPFSQQPILIEAAPDEAFETIVSAVRAFSV